MGKYRGSYPPCVRQKLPFYESPCGCVSVSRALEAGRPLKHPASGSPNSLPAESPGTRGWGSEGEKTVEITRPGSWCHSPGRSEEALCPAKSHPPPPPRLGEHVGQVPNPLCAG